MLGLPATATEKIDGSNFSVHIYKGGHDFRSRNQDVNTHEGGLFFQAIQIVGEKIDRIRGLLGNDIILYFEVFGRGVQKRINYDKILEKCPHVIDGRSVALIDICSLPEKEGDKRTWFGSASISGTGVDVGFWTPPVKFYPRLTMADIEEILARTDTEGDVVKTVDEMCRPVRNHYGDRQMVKVKTDWYTSYEKKDGGEKKAKPKTPPEIIDFLLDRVNFGRLHSVYSHGHEGLKREMSDMQVLPTIVLEDIRGEAAEHDIWTQFEDKAIRRVVAHMLPRVMKSWFLEEPVK